MAASLILFLPWAIWAVGLDGQKMQRAVVSKSEPRKMTEECCIIFVCVCFISLGTGIENELNAVVCGISFVILVPLQLNIE